MESFKGKDNYKFSDEQLEKLVNVLDEGNKKIAALLEKRMDEAENEKEKAFYLE